MTGEPHDDQTIRTIRQGVTDGLSYSQIGDLLGLSRNAVAGIVYRRARGIRPAAVQRRPYQGTYLHDVPHIRESIVRSIEAGMTDAAAARAAGVDAAIIGNLRDALARQGVTLPRHHLSIEDRMAPLKAANALKTRQKAAPVNPAPTKPNAPSAPKPSAFALRGLVLVSSTPRPINPGSATTWTDMDIIRLREVCRTEPTAVDAARALGRPYSSVRHMMTELGINPTYMPQEQHLSAIERLHREGVPVRRICLRTGVPIPLVERHLARIGVGKYGGSSPQDVGKRRVG